MPVRQNEDEYNSQFNRKKGNGPNSKLDAEASMRIRVRVRDLVSLLENLDIAKESLFPDTRTKIGISGIRKTEADSPRIISSEVSFRGKRNPNATFVLNTMLRRIIR